MKRLPIEQLKTEVKHAHFRATFELPKEYDTNMRPRISIVTPSLNQGQFLEETICSVINQNYDNLEYIVIDGGSTDNSNDIIKKYSPFITYWVSEKDNGQSDAINKGLRIATGEIMCWINSDDFLEPDCLNKVSHYFERNPSWECITGACNLIYHSANGQVEHRSHRAPPTNPNMATLNWKEEWFAQQATFWRTSLWKRTGPLREDLKYTMDLELWRRFSKLTLIQPVSDTLATYRFHQDAKCVAHHQRSIMEEFQINSEYYFLENAKNTLIFENQVKSLAKQITNLQTTLQQYEDERARVLAENAMLLDLKESVERSRLYKLLQLLSHLRLKTPLSFPQNKHKNLLRTKTEQLNDTNTNSV
jgi:glycosyltransferase involved in cell wall biosynthesis